MLPNNKNIIPVAEQVDELTTKTVRVVPTTGVAEGFAALMEYDPEGDAASNAERMTRVRGAGGVGRGHPGGARLVDARRAGEARATSSASRAEASWWSRRRWPTRPPGCSTSSSPTTTRSSPSSRARARRPRDTRRITEWLAEHHPDVAAEVHHGGQPLYPYLLSGRVGWRGGCAQLADAAGARCSTGVGPKKAEALATMEIETVLDLLTHYPRRYLDRTQQAAIKDLKVGDEAMVLATVKRVQSRRTRQRRALVEVDVFDGTSYLRCTFFNQPWRAKQLKEGTEAVFFGKLEALPGPAADDEPGRRPHRRRTGPHHSHLPAVREGRAHHVGARRLGRGGAAAGGRASPTRCRPSGATGSTSSTARGRSARSTRRSRWPPRRRRASASSSTSCCGCSSRSSCASARSSATRRASVTSSTASSCAASTPALPFPLTGAQQQGDRGDRGRPRRPAPDAPAAAGRRRFGQDGRRRHRAADGRAGRVPGRVDGADRGAGRAARPRRARPAPRPHRAGRARARCSPTGRCASSC